MSLEVLMLRIVASIRKIIAPEYRTAIDVIVIRVIIWICVVLVLV